MAKTRMEVVYDSLHNELETIMNENQYCNISKAEILSTKVSYLP